MERKEIHRLGWVLGFEACANWEMTPTPERKYDKAGECINPTRRIKPEDPRYLNGFEEYIKIGAGA